MSIANTTINTNTTDKSMQDQSYPSKDAFIQIDHIDDILKITDSFEMDNAIAKNTANITRIFDSFLNKLYSKIEASKDQIDQLIYSLKFVDTLNLFMNHFTLSKLSEYMNKIFNMMLISSHNPEIKDTIIKQIKYTEMTVITLKKKEFRNLFFGDGKSLGTEIEFHLDQVNKNGKFDQKLFKQLQNLFYVVQRRIEEAKRSELQQRLNEMKTLSIRLKKQKVYLNYDDYNDYSDYKNYSNVSGNLQDYNENFYENDEYSYSNYGNYNNQERYGYRRYSYRNNNSSNSNYYYKQFENEEREIEHVVEVGNEVQQYNNNSSNSNKHLELKEIEEVSQSQSQHQLQTQQQQQPQQQNESIEDKANMNTPMNDNNTINKANEGNAIRKTDTGNSNSNSNNTDIEIIKTVIPSKSHYDYNSNSHYHRNNNNNNHAYQQGNQALQGNNNNNNNSNNNSTNANNEYTPIKKKIILKKNQKQRGQTLVEVPIPNTPEETNTNRLNDFPTKIIETEIQSTPKQSAIAVEVEFKREETKQIKDESQSQSSHTTNTTHIQSNDTEIITTVINTTQDNNNNNNPISPPKQQYTNNNNSNMNQKFNQYGYKQNQYGGSGKNNQGYYYNYSSNYHNNSNYNNNNYHHNNYYSTNQMQNSNNPNDNYNNNYYKKNNQGKKYYQQKPTVDFVELDDLRSDKQEQSAQSSPEGKREDKDKNELLKLKEDKEDKETVKIDLEKMFEKEKEKQKEGTASVIEVKEIPQIKETVNVNVNAMSDPIHDIQEEQLICGEESEEEEENEELERDESSDSIEEEELEREYNKFISESLGQIPKNNDENFYNDQEEDDDTKKNNKIIFEDEGDDKKEDKAKEATGKEGEKSNEEILNNIVNPSLLIPTIESTDINMIPLIEPLANTPVIEQNQDIPNIIPSSTVIEGIDNTIKKETEEQTKKGEDDLTLNQEGAKNEGEHLIPSENMKEELITAAEHETELEHENEPSEHIRSNKYTESIKTIDPKILETIKTKLSEDFEKNQQQLQQQQQQTLQQIPAYVNFQASFPNGNSQMFHPGLLSLMAFYQKQIQTSNNANKIPLQTYIFNHYTQFLYHGRDSNIHKEYILLKAQEIENSYSIWQNINNFENKIIIPIYQRINFNVNKKRRIYYITFMKYKKLIQHILAKDKVLEKVKPYGSYMNNFLIDSGDIDICIVPKCNILEFASYLDRIKEQIIIKNIGEHKLSHHTGRYLLLKVLDHQTKFIIDITVHTMLPILNTNLVRLYSLYDQRFHILGLYIKHWAKINKIHGAADSFLSSYALLLMLIHFLQKVVEPRVLPNLQRIENREVPYQYYVNGEIITTNIYYEEDLNKIKTYMKKINNGLENKETATNLLVKFFEYYSYYFESEQRISIHKEVNELTKKPSETIAFSIEDPFDIQHDPGKSMAVNSVQCNKFITSMKKEINYILNGEYVKRIDKICPNSNSNNNGNGSNAGKN